MFSILPLWKKEGGGAFFLLFMKMAAGHIFQNNWPAYFFKMARQTYVTIFTANGKVDAGV